MTQELFFEELIDNANEATDGLKGRAIRITLDAKAQARNELFSCSLTPFPLPKRGSASAGNLDRRQRARAGKASDNPNGEAR
eukprot:7380278-Prymnesium_polylepis.2